jgi:hypothetical protein
MGYVILRVTDRRQRVRIRALTGLGIGGIITILTCSDGHPHGRIVSISENAQKPGCHHGQRPGMVLVNGPGVVIVPPGSGCDADCIYALEA